MKLILEQILPFIISDNRYCEKVRASIATAEGERINTVDQLNTNAKTSPNRLLAEPIPVYKELNNLICDN